ncbi:MAG: Ppx/GppA phosphatase family protein [Microthrixaceae bacterium]
MHPSGSAGPTRSKSTGKLPERPDPESGVSSDMPEVVAAIDVGTNSVHMVVARSAPSGRFEVLTKHKEVVRLGSGVGDMKELSSDAMDRGVAALGRCADIANGLDAEVFAVATSAVREATNAAEFTRRALEEAGVTVNVISGIEEARLIQLGVLQALPLYDRPLLLVDVGGGSTEVLIGLGTEVLFARSHKLGSIRMTRAFFAEARVGDQDVQRCRNFIRARLAAAAHEAEPFVHEVAVACSGTAETLFRMSIARKGDSAPSEMTGQVLTRKALKKVVSDLIEARTVEERSELPGIDRSRSDILLGGALVLEGVCEAFGVESLTFSDYAARGRASRRFRPPAFVDRNAASVRSPSRIGHAPARGLRRGSASRSEGRTPCPGAVRSARRSARPGRCGQGAARGRCAARQHGPVHLAQRTPQAQLLRDPQLGAPHGFHRQQGADRADRPLPPQESAVGVEAPGVRALGEEDRERVRSMAALLRVAIALDRNHDGGVSSVSLVGRPGDPRRSGDSGTGDVLELQLHPATERDLDLELFSANDRAGMLADRLGVPVVLTAAPST